MEPESTMSALFEKKKFPLHDAAEADDLAAVENMLSGGTWVDVRDGSLQTALHVAASAGATATAVTLMDGGADINAVNRHLFTPLHFSISEGATDISLMLIERGANVNAPGKEAYTPLHFCAGAGATEVASALIAKGANVNAMDANLQTPLHCCATAKSTDVALALLESGADIEAAEENSLTPLQFCAAAAATDIALALLERGANVHAEVKGHTALHVCAKVGATEIAFALLERGADANAVDEDWMTPLHICAAKGMKEIAMALIKRGADIDAVNRASRTALHVCAAMGTTDVALALLEGGANVNVADNKSRTPLYICAEEGSADIASALLERGADVDAAAENSLKPLHVCAVYGTRDVAFALLERNADVDVLWQKKFTPLHFCAATGTADVASLLIERGANVNALSEDLDTPLQTAARKGNIAILRELLKTDARFDCQNESGDSALHLALVHAQPDCACELIERASEHVVNLKNDSGQTALHVAALVGAEPIAQMLVDSGARRNIRDNAGNLPLDYVPADQATFRILLAITPEPPPSPTPTFSTFPTVSTFPSSSSSSSTWTPEVPFGSRQRMLNALELLKPGDAFTENYIIKAGAILGKPHARIAQEKVRKQEEVVIKFYWEEVTFDNTVESHEQLCSSDHICRIVQKLKTAPTGFPPSIIFEKGTCTINEWNRSDHSLLDKKWCLHQVLTGIRDIHEGGIVHSDLKPCNVMFFSSSVRWKLIDFDGACKAGKQAAHTFTFAYAAPEILKAWNDKKELPVARPSLDLWSFGVIAFEVLTGQRFYEEDVTPNDIYYQIIETGRAEHNLEHVKDVLQRELLSNLLKMDPMARYTASEALQHDFFKSDSITTTTAALQDNLFGQESAARRSRLRKIFGWMLNRKRK